ncbi:MAG: hypothetical protein M1836_004462 [Candelina mexicana]|nr:MAG: hypothetical protein M1836_004462 [Candelina mexicana]
MGGESPTIQLPLHNLTALQTNVAPSWVPQPNTRGTSDILYSCTFTLVLCVWTSIHPNVTVGEKPIVFHLRKIIWLIGAVLFPELMVFFAYEEWASAKKIQKDLNELSKQQEKQITFSMAYTFYTVMRGFLINIRGADDKDVPHFITSQGMKYFAQRNVFIELSEASIRDKSKADIFAKSLVCVQVLWVVAEVIARKAAGYPITLLELHTLVNILCALLLYSFWFSKPLGIEDPTVVDSPPLQELLASLKKPANRLCESDRGVLDLLQPYFVPFKGFTLYTHFSGSRRSSLAKLLVIVLVSSSYGGIHLAAWNSFFPTRVERLLWQISSIMSMAVPVFMIAVYIAGEFGIVFLVPHQSRISQRLGVFRARWARRQFTIYIFTGLAVVVPCRLFIVVESYISLRHVPIGVYATVPWSSYVPHL